MRPLLLLDIDGVLCPLGRHDDPQLDEVVIDDIPRLLSRDAGERLSELLQHFNLVWASSWGATANRELAPVLGLPPLPFVNFESDTPLGKSYKLRDIQAFVGDRPCAYVDDDIGLDVETWAGEREAPTLLVRPDPRRGLEQDDIEQLLQFARSLREASP